MENKETRKYGSGHNLQDDKDQKSVIEKGNDEKPNAELYLSPADGRPMPNAVTDNKSDGDAQKPVEDATLHHFNTDKRKHDDQVGAENLLP